MLPRSDARDGEIMHHCGTCHDVSRKMISAGRSPAQVRSCVFSGFFLCQFAETKVTNHA